MQQGPTKHNPDADAVADELFANRFFDSSDSVQVKYEMLRRVAIEGVSVRDAVVAFGYSRQAFYHARADFEQNGMAGLVPFSRGRKEKRTLSMEVLNSIHESQGTPDKPPQPGERARGTFVSADLEIDFATRRVRAGQRNVHLTATQFNILRHLFSHAGKPVSNRELMQVALGRNNWGDMSSLRVHVSLLRKKIEPDPSKPTYILTEPWIGYRFAG